LEQVDEDRESMSAMEFVLEILFGLAEEALLELGLRALFRVPGIAADLRTQGIQTVFSNHPLS
jgi:hypothetical protein